MKLSLQPVEGPECNQLTIEATLQDIVLGRHADCDILLQSQFVSRFHASLVYKQGTWFIIDLDSRDGVFIDSIRIEPKEATLLHDGVILSIGPFVFIVSGTGSSSFTPIENNCNCENSSDTMQTNASLIHALNDEATGRRESAWNLFVQRYEPVIRLVSRRYRLHTQDIDDVVQDVLLGLFRTGDIGYDRTKGQFRSYLKTATKNAIVNKWKCRSQEDQGLPDVAVESFDSQWERRWREHVLQLALHSVQHMVEPKHYEAFELFGRRGVPAQQVAQSLNMTVESVRQAKFRIMVLVQSEIARLDDVQ